MCSGRRWRGAGPRRPRRDAGIIRGLLVPALAIAGCESGDRPVAADETRNDPQQSSSPSFRLADEPDVVIGVADGSPEQELFEVAGAARLADGSVVIYEAGAFRLQKFGPDGGHLWSRGQAGDGPGDFDTFAELLVPCANRESILIYGPYARRMTVFDGDGALLRTYPFAFQETQPYDLTCTPAGRLVFSGWGHERPTEPGPYRTTADVGFADSAVVTVLREDVVGEDRLATANAAGILTGSAPGIWSRKLRFAATDEGVWLGTGDDYEIELLDWTGSTTRTIRWEGPDRAVTQTHVDAYREAVRDSFANGLDFVARNHPDAVNPRDWEGRFESRWERDQGALPPAFPAYADVRLGDDGAIWIQEFARPGERSEWFALNDDGERTRAVIVPPEMTLLDIGADWALVTFRDELDVERVALYSFVEN